MTTLFIDTHLNDIIVYLIKDNIIVNKGEVINKKNNSEFMMPTITNVIGDETLDEIIVVNGPGSFTGVRLGVTIAKTLAYTLKTSIKTISALKVMAISNNTRSVAIDEGNGYYVGIFDDSYEKLEDYKYISKKDDFDESNYDMNYNIDVLKIIEYMKDVEEENPHGVNPIYIKKIGVEIDKESKNN